MKKILILSILSLSSVAIYACPVCDKQQPKILRGIAHGAGPDSNVDYAIVIVMSIIVLVTLFYSVKYLVKPKENEDNHIKRTIITFE
jgi:hypothetical protein